MLCSRRRPTKAIATVPRPSRLASISGLQRLLDAGGVVQAVADDREARDFSISRAAGTPLAGGFTSAAYQNGSAGETWEVEGTAKPFHAAWTRTSRSIAAERAARDAGALNGGRRVFEPGESPPTSGSRRVFV